MTSFDYEFRATQPNGTEVCRIRISSSDQFWVVEFGIEGPNVGLYSVNVSKMRAAHLNLLGLLEVALRELRMDKKNSTTAGMVLEAFGHVKELGS